MYLVHDTLIIGLNYGLGVATDPKIILYLRSDAGQLLIALPQLAPHHLEGILDRHHVLRHPDRRVGTTKQTAGAHQQFRAGVVEGHRLVVLLAEDRGVVRSVLVRGRTCVWVLEFLSAERCGLRRGLMLAVLSGFAP